MHKRQADYDNTDDHQPHTRTRTHSPTESHQLGYKATCKLAAADVMRTYMTTTNPHHPRNALAPKHALACNNATDFATIRAWVAEMAVDRHTWVDQYPAYMLELVLAAQQAHPRILATFITYFTNELPPVDLTALASAFISIQPEDLTDTLAEYGNTVWNMCTKWHISNKRTLVETAAHNFSILYTLHPNLIAHQIQTISYLASELDMFPIFGTTYIHHLDPTYIAAVMNLASKDDRIKFITTCAQSRQTLEWLFDFTNHPTHAHILDLVYR